MHSVEASRVKSLPTIEVPNVDLDAIARAAEEERRKDEEAQKLAEERRKEFAGRQAEIEQKNAEQEKKDRDVRRRQSRQERWLREAAATDAGQRRVAMTAKQRWVVEKLQFLAQLDPDRAAVKNDVGFSASDGGIGHKLAFLAPLVGLTDGEWSLAVALCHKYRRQVGEFQNISHDMETK